MDKITKSIIFDLIKAGNPIEMISYELGVSSHDIKTALQDADRSKISNILADQLASRLPALLEMSFKQLEHILLNAPADRRLAAANIIVKSATAVAKLKP